MFIIVPKHREQAPPKASDGHPQSANATAADDKEPVRVAAACDPCRVKKTKCNGQQPCEPCRRKHTICVYSRSTHRDNIPLSAAQASLLQHQQRRMYAAIQQMASIIAKLENGLASDPLSFDVPELLNKYAPQGVLDSQKDASPASSSSRPSKRRREEDPPATDAMSLGELSPFSATGNQYPMPFELQPAPAFADGGAQGGSQAYDAMMQLMRSVNNKGNSGAAAPNQPNPLSPGLTTSMAAMEGPYTAGAIKDEENMPWSSPYPGNNMAPMDFLNLVDWNASLANLQNFDSTFYGEENPIDYTNQMINDGFNSPETDKMNQSNMTMDEM